MADFASLYDAARDKTTAARATRDALLETPYQFVHKVSTARHKLLTEILESAGDKILDAAERGYGTVDVLTFNGNEFLDDVSVLFLLKGPRPHTPPIPEGTPGPLLPDLQAAMAPFELVHDWDGVTGGNRLIARWAAISY